MTPTICYVTLCPTSQKQEIKRNKKIHKTESINNAITDLITKALKLQHIFSYKKKENTATREKLIITTI